MNYFCMPKKIKKIKTVRKRMTIDDLARITMKGFEQVDKRFEQVDKRFEQVDKKFGIVYKRLDETDKKIEALDSKFENKHRSIMETLDAMAKNLRDFQVEMASNIMAHDRFQKYYENIEKRLIRLEIKQGLRPKIGARVKR